MNMIYDKGRSLGRDFQQEFRGINRKLRATETEFEDAVNLSASEYPALVTRGERNYITDIGRCGFPSLCSLGDGSVAYIGESGKKHYIFIDGKKEYEFEGALTTPHSMVKMGQYLCVFPEGIVYNVTDKTAKRIESVLSNRDNGELTFTPCKIDGQIAVVAEQAPSSATVGDVWYNPRENKTYLCTAVANGWFTEKAIIYANNMDLAFATDRPLYAVQVSSFTGGLADGTQGTLYTYNGDTYVSSDIKVPIGTKLPDSASNGSFMLINDSVDVKKTLWQYKVNRPQWTEYPTSYTRISAAQSDITEYFSEGDVVEIEGFGYARIFTAVPGTDSEDGYIVTDGMSLYGTYYYAEHPISVSRKMPKGITNIIESANRLWGTDENGKEIYASKLGDPFNWNAFTGIASDSYVITVGSGGVFTGAISYDGYPHFFKENSILKVYGNYPFRLYTLDCPGVASNAGRSPSIYNGSVIYKGVDGFYAYSGGYPTSISDDVSEIANDEYAVTASASDGASYYAAVQRGSTAVIYVYRKGLWHLHDAGLLSSGDVDSIADMCFTGRGVLAAMAADDVDLGQDLGYEDPLYPTYYLTTLSGKGPKGIETDPKVLLKKVTMDITPGADISEYNYVLTQQTTDFRLLKAGEIVTINGIQYTVKRVFMANEKLAVAEIGDITDVNTLAKDECDVCVFLPDDLIWRFETAKYGLTLPQDKWYSHFTFRYKATDPIKVYFNYSDGHRDKFILPPKSTFGSESIMLSPRQTEYMTVYAQGEGQFALLSICKNIEGGNTP